jgi:AcrR family transcriptional regulator
VSPQPRRPPQRVPVGEREGPRLHPRAADGEVTRELLLDIAEELFAREGVGAVSIRSVNSAAGLAPASVHYHFGSKEGLVQAVLVRRGRFVIARHSQLLDELETRDGVHARDLVAALAAPFVELIEQDPERGHRWVKFAAQLAQSHHPVMQRLTTRPSDPDARFQELVIRLYHGVPEDEARLRWRIGGNTLLRLLADADGPLSLGVAEAPPGAVSKRFVEALIDFVASGVDGLAR